MILKTDNLKQRKEKQLLHYYSSLNVSDKETLLTFAEFLSSRVTNENLDNDNINNKKKGNNEVVQIIPLKIERPKTESVIHAIKRLTDTYSMIEKEKLLHSISDLMTAHMMQGKTAEIVIDELESLFFNEYESSKLN